MKKIILWLVVGALTVSMAFVGMACTAGTTTTAAAAETTATVETTAAATTAAATTAAETTTEMPKIGYITRLAVPWWTICDIGFKDAGTEFGFEPIIYDPPQLTVEDQVRVMETWIPAGLDGIMIGPNDPEAVVSVINQAIDAGIPVVTGYGVDSPNSKRLLFIGYAARELGVALGKGLLAQLKLQGIEPPGKISYHTGGMASTEDVASLEGFKEPVEAAGFTVVEPVLDEGDAAKAVARAAETIALYPDLVGMLGYYDYTGPALGKAVTDAGKIDQIVVQGDGFIGEMVPYLESGAIDATIDLVQYEGSRLGGEILYKLIQAGKEGWDSVLTEYPAENKEIMLGVGYITFNEEDIEMWPEISWKKSFEQWKSDYPVVWDIIK
jgi:ribose transport system substrate-binding protein